MWIGLMCAVALVFGASAAAAPPANVPGSYRATYAALSGQLEHFAATVKPAAAGSPLVISPGLEAADGNGLAPGPVLQSRLAASELMLERLRSAGATGVTVQVNFPLLVSGFPDSSQYRSFYAQLAAAIHAAGMTLTVEENPLFENISTLPVRAFYTGLTLDRYTAQMRQQTQAVIDSMQPKWVAILTEPDTNDLLLATPSIDLEHAPTAVAFVQGVLRGLRRNRARVGAGSGTWQDGSLDRAILSQTSIDFLDLHTFFFTATDLGYQAREVAEAQAARKPVVMTECWLYKSSTNGKPVDTSQASPNEQKVDQFDFWEPLDELFLRSMVGYARDDGFAVVSPFSSEELFAYEPWSPSVEALPWVSERSEYYARVGEAMSTGSLSPVGGTLRKLARS